MSELLDRALELGHRELEADMKQALVRWSQCREQILKYAGELKIFCMEVNDPTVIIYINRELKKTNQWIYKNMLLPTEPIPEFATHEFF